MKHLNVSLTEPDMNTHPHTDTLFAWVRGAQHALNASDTALALRSN